MSFFLTVEKNRAFISTNEDGIILEVLKPLGNGKTEVSNGTWKLNVDKSCITVTNQSKIAFFTWSAEGKHVLDIRPTLFQFFISFFAFVVVGFVTVAICVYCYAFGQQMFALIFSAPVRTPIFNTTLFNGGTWIYGKNGWILLNACTLYNMRETGYFEVLALISNGGFCMFTINRNKILLKDANTEIVLAESPTQITNFTFDGRRFLF